MEAKVKLNKDQLDRLRLTRNTMLRRARHYDRLAKKESPGCPEYCDHAGHADGLREAATLLREEFQALPAR